ncbi:MAG: hypothetical protein IPN86_12640 [Saprospiraceae bacterium]|nr:hypothetical protein [Saprospiraceae bacterium]
MPLVIIITSLFILIFVIFLFYRNNQKNIPANELLISRYEHLISYLAKESSAKITKSGKREVQIRSVKKGTVWTYNIRENSNNGLSIEYIYDGGVLGKHILTWNFPGDEQLEKMLETISNDIQLMFNKILFNR